MPTEDRRRHPRLQADGPVTIVTQSGCTIIAEATDVNLLGCGVSSTDHLEVGEFVTVTLRLPAGSMCTTEGVVQSSGGTGPFHYGIRFSEACVERLLKQFFKVH